MSIQERHIFQTSHLGLYNEPPSFLLKSGFIKTYKMTAKIYFAATFFQKENRKIILKQSIQLCRTLKFLGEVINHRAAVGIYIY